MREESGEWTEQALFSQEGEKHHELGVRTETQDSSAQGEKAGAERDVFGSTRQGKPSDLCVGQGEKMRGRKNGGHDQLCSLGPSRLDMALLASAGAQLWDRP